MKQYISNKGIATQDEANLVVKLGFRTDDGYADYEPDIGCFNLVKNYHYTYGYILVTINLSKLGTEITIHNNPRSCNVDLDTLQYSIGVVSNHIMNDLFVLEHKGIIKTVK